MKKQIVSVYEAVEAGCETSDDVAVYTGFSLATSSKYLSDLRADGLISIKERNARRMGDRGPFMHVYELSKGRAA